MGTTKTLLFPFQTGTTFFDGYAWALELAFRIKGKLQLFTTLPEVNPDTDPVYHLMLEAHGYYLQHYSRHEREGNPKTEPAFGTGDLEEELSHYLSENPVDILILDAAFLAGHSTTLPSLIRRAKGTIALSPPSDNESLKQDEHFYDHLQRAELHKLPPNFFSMLSQDREAFNYLRKFFQRKNT